MKRSEYSTDKARTFSLHEKKVATALASNAASPSEPRSSGANEAKAVRSTAATGSAALISEHCVEVHYLSRERVAVRFKRGTPLPIKRVVANLLRRRCAQRIDQQKVGAG